jgi:N,N-dimethylformamidase
MGKPELDLRANIIRGYANDPSFMPGDRVDLRVSASEDGEYSAALVRPRKSLAGPASQVIAEMVQSLGRYPGRFQPTAVGSRLVVAVKEGLSSSGLAVHAFVWPTLTVARPQAIVSWRSAVSGDAWLLALEDGRLVFTCTDAAGHTAAIRVDQRLVDRVWYSVVSSFPLGGGELCVEAVPVVTSENSVFGPVAGFDGASATGACDIQLSEGPGELTIGAMNDRDSQYVAHFNGKIEFPKVFGCPLTAGQRARLAAGDDVDAQPQVALDFSARHPAEGSATDVVVDVSGDQRHGVCINQPTRWRTGWRWDGSAYSWRESPSQYGAIWFHEDALDDCRWDIDFSFELPADLPSGYYAVRLELNGVTDEVPLFVRRAPHSAPKPLLVLLSTLTYAAYAGYISLSPWSDGPGYDAWESVTGNVLVVEAHRVQPDGTVLPFVRRDEPRPIGPYGLCVYDHYADGSGVSIATWRKPMLNTRPEDPTIGEDLTLLSWLDAQGIEYDIATDHDLVREGEGLLRPYRAVTTGWHPEYVTEGMLDAWESYLASGGRALYPGGNGFYWVTVVHPDKPWLIEVPDKTYGDGSWVGLPGEAYSSFTGELGGAWRQRGRPPQKLLGVGYTAHPLDQGAPFRQTSDAADERLDWMLAGICRDELIGDFDGGAAAAEVDRYDLALGTPPHARVLASSVGEHSPNAHLLPDDVAHSHPAMGFDEHPLIRGDIVYFTTRDGGGVFSAASMGWCRALAWNGGDNNVSRLTANVVRRFILPEPLESLE